MLYSASILYRKNNSVKARWFRADTGAWWNGTEWSSSELFALLYQLTKVELLSTISDRYTGSIPVPPGTGTWIIEFVGGTSGLVFAEDSIPVVDSTTMTPDINSIFNTPIPESYANIGSNFTLGQAIYMIHQAISEKSISGNTLYVRKINGIDEAMRFSINSIDNPTGIMRIN